MANNEKGNPPAPLEPQVVKKLLDLLSTDDDFRNLFEKDATAALTKAGYKPSDPSLKGTEGSALSSGNCLQLKAGAKIASKADIIRDWSKIEAELKGIHSFICPSALQAD